MAVLAGHMLADHTVRKWNQSCIYSETPNNDAGKDSVPFSRYVQVFDGSRLADVEINKIVSKDICGKSTRKINVRVHAIDKGEQEFELHS